MQSIIFSVFSVPSLCRGHIYTNLIVFTYKSNLFRPILYSDFLHRQTGIPCGKTPENGREISSLHFQERPFLPSLFPPSLPLIVCLPNAPSVSSRPYGQPQKKIGPDQGPIFRSFVFQGDAPIFLRVGDPPIRHPGPCRVPPEPNAHCGWRYSPPPGHRNTYAGHPTRRYRGLHR